MAIEPIRLPRLPQRQEFTDPQTGLPTKQGQLWWQRAMEQIEGSVNGVIEAQNAADAAAASAATAQAAAEAAQDAVDGLVIPPTGVLPTSVSAALDETIVTVLVDATGGAVTIILSAAASYTVPVVITKVDATGNAVDVTPGGGDTLNGGAGPVSLTAPNETKTFTADQIDQWFG